MVRYVHLPGAAVDTALLEDATRRGREILCLIFWIYLIRCLQKPLSKLQSLDDGAKDTADPEDFYGDYPKVVLFGVDVSAYLHGRFCNQSKLSTESWKIPSYPQAPQTHVLMFQPR